MKSQLRIIAVSCMFLTLFFSCKKDEKPEENNTVTPPVVTNYVEYNGTKHEIMKCFFEYDDVFSNPGAHVYTVSLASQNVSYNNFNESITGNGYGIKLIMFVSNIGEFVGTYMIDTTNNQLEAGELTYVRVLINDSFFMPSNAILMKTAQISISKPSSDLYLITGSCVSTNDKPVNIYYKGSAFVRN
jgi:hypothetical protein